MLASASPRRLELLRQVGLDPIVDPASVDETPDPAFSPAENAARFAAAKASTVAARRPATDLVLGADTIVVSDGQLLGKPRDAADAEAMLRRLAGRLHHVVTCVAFAPAPGWPATALTVRTSVVFRDLADEEVADHVASGEWRDKAGGYAIQGRAAAFTRAVIGSYSNVVGLPLCEVVEELRLRGFPMRLAGARV